MQAAWKIWIRLPTTIAACVILLFLDRLVGTAWHEAVGHGLVGTMFGGQVGRVIVRGFEIFPQFAWHDDAREYGSCEVYGIESETGRQMMHLGGSMSTWLVSVVAVVLLCLKPRRRLTRTILVLLGIWWLDLLTYTLPSLGVRRLILWGGYPPAEPYDAAVALGIPGPLFQAFVIGSSVVLAGCTVYALVRVQRPKKRPT